MQPLLCKGGYPMPITKGKFEILAVHATIEDTTAAARLTLLDSDDFAVVPDGVTMQYKDNHNNRRLIFDQKVIANSSGAIEMVFAEPLKTIRGVSVNSLSSNTEGGKVFVYVK